ncbi:MAG: 30S ribosomal protein S20, partial [Candidatus Levyibacteriota bacterium]
KKLEQAFSTAQKTRTPKAISMAFSVIDKGVKKNLIHKNKAKRMKSKLTRTPKQGAEKVAVKVTKPVKKRSVKKPANKTKKTK